MDRYILLAICKKRSLWVSTIYRTISSNVNVKIDCSGRSLSHTLKSTRKTAIIIRFMLKLKIWSETVWWDDTGSELPK